ncbi:Alpha/beta hydrolase [Bordetella tumbae]|uniref:alpha/beta fold hydrolase n=1 Tax=Bordetella tumbae TaxID=1649139 RepID=UPI0039EE6DE6
MNTAATVKVLDTQGTQTAWADLHVQGRSMRLEYRWLSPERQDAPLLIFLHEGLGSVAMWKDWPQRVCDAAACRGLVFSRYGYGQSTPRPAAEKWPVTFMHDQAREILPALLKALHIDAERDRPILFGHSDGGSIALLYAAMHPQAIAGLVVAAPHVFVEDVTIAHIEQARQAYLHTDLPAKLARYHADADSAFWGWNDIWLNPAFRAWNIQEYLPRIKCPVLAIQGQDDEYGTMAQIHSIREAAAQARLLKIPDCRHSPHIDQPDVVIRAVAEFIDGLNKHG